MPLPKRSGNVLKAPRNSMCRLSTRSSGLRNILRCLQKRKGNTWDEIQEECVLPVSRKLVGTYMGENSFASVARRADITNQDNKYRTLVEKSIQLEVNNWPKFQEHLKKLYSAEFYQAPAQQPVGNVVVQTKTHVGSTNPTRTSPKSAKYPTKQLLHKSPIRPPKSIQDRQKNLSLIRPEQLKQNSHAPISQAGKIQINTKGNNEKPGSAFKMPLRTKSLIRTNKLRNAQG